MSPIVIIICIGFFYLVYKGFILEAEEKEKRKKVEKNILVQNKLNLQNFVLATKEVFPSYTLNISNEIATFKGPLKNSYKKNIGEVKVSGNYNISYPKRTSYINAYINITIDDKGYRVDRRFIDNNQKTLEVTLKDMWQELMSTEDLKKRIIATTY